MPHITPSYSHTNSKGNQTQNEEFIGSYRYHGDLLAGEGEEGKSARDGGKERGSADEAAGGEEMKQQQDHICRVQCDNKSTDRAESMDIEDSVRTEGKGIEDGGRTEGKCIEDGSRNEGKVAKAYNCRKEGAVNTTIVCGRELISTDAILAFVEDVRFS